MSDIANEIEESVTQATSRGTFNIVETILGRAYPSKKVEVYFDEELAFKAAETLSELEDSEIVDGSGEVSERTLELRELFNKHVEDLQKSKFVFTVGGISEGDREELLNKAIESYPMEYDEHQNPITGAIDKIEKINPERNRFFNNLVWQAQIRSVVNPEGQVQDSFTLEDIAVLRRNLPVAATAAINEAIEQVRLSTAVFMARVNEDFLAKR